MDNGELKRAGRGRPKLRLGHNCAEKGHAKRVLKRPTETFRYKDDHSQMERRASWRSLRSSYIPHSQSGGEAHQSPQALQASGDPIRETSGELRGDAKDS